MMFLFYDALAFTEVFALLVTHKSNTYHYFQTNKSIYSLKSQ